MDVQAEIRDLKRRVGELEGSFGFLMGQVRDVHRDLLNFQASTEAWQGRAEAWQGRAEQRFERIEVRLDHVEQKIDELPRTLAEVIRSEFERRDAR